MALPGPVPLDGSVVHYEYRRYEVTPGRMEDLLDRFERTTLGVWDDIGIRPVGFWQSDIGRSSHLHYLLTWDRLDDRTERLHAFRSDSRWVKAKEDTEQDGPLIQFAETELWTPTRFSALQ